MEKIYDIKGYEERYGITKNGIVYSYPKLKARHKKTMKLNMPIDKDGYHTVFLYKNGNIKHERVNRLMAETFLDKKQFKSMPCENRNKINLDELQVNHKDENKSNDNIDNLEWCTIKYNSNYGNRNAKTIEKISKPIIQYDLEMNKIAIHKSGYEIKRKLGYDNSLIAKRCKDHKKAYNYYWRYANEERRN
jgi:hypothetical protein